MMFSLSEVSELSSANVVLPSVGEVHSALRSCFSRSVCGQIGGDDILEACQLGPKDQTYDSRETKIRAPMLRMKQEFMRYSYGS